MILISDYYNMMKQRVNQKNSKNGKISKNELVNDVSSV